MILPPAQARTDVQRQFFDLLMVSQHWSPQQMQNYQRTRLKPLLNHAQANVPFYEHRLDPLFRPDGEIDWDRWLEIPLVTRADLADRRQELQARTMPPGQGQIATFSTSGSTGAPVFTTHNALASLMSRATAFRSNMWHGIDWSRDIGHWYGEKPDVGAYPDGTPGTRWGPAWSPIATGLQYEINRLTAVDDTLEFFQRKRPKYLAVGATDARVLAHEALRLGLQLPIDAVLTRSAAVTDYGEALLQRAFGAKAIPLYSSKEGYSLAHPCPAAKVHHVNSEIVLLEVLRPDGLPCGPGETGRVVITPLFSTAQPLIRYDQGDFATVGEPCPCGRHLPVLTEIVGRAKHLFRMPDGRLLWPRINADALIGLDAVSFQIAQVSQEEIEVRYVPRDWHVVGGEAALVAALHRATDPALRVTFKRLKSFDLPMNRKHLEYVSELGETA